MTIRLVQRFCNVMIAGAVFLALPPGAMAGNFAPPDIEGFNKHAERDADGDGDGVKETHIIQYFNMQGDSIVSMSTRGRVWAWSLDTRDSKTGDANYVIRDSDCDDTYDEVYGLDDEFHLPDCLK